MLRLFSFRTRLFRNVRRRARRRCSAYFETLESRLACAALDRLTDIAPGSLGVFGDARPTAITDFKGQPFFVATDYSRGDELWAWDSQSRASRQVKDINPVAYASGVDRRAGLVAAGDSLYFVADDGVHGKELWKSDGTPDGTSLVVDLTPGRDSTSIAHLTNMNGVLYFHARRNNSLPGELWKSDGTPAGTVRVEALNAVAGGGSRFLDDRRTPFLTSGAAVYFAVETSQSRYDLYRTDGAPDSAVRLAQNLASHPQMVASGAHVFFSNWNQVWQTDGTAASTRVVWSTAFGVNSPVRSLNATGGMAYFAARDAEGHDAIYAADGRLNGTRQVHREPTPQTFIRQLVDLGGTVLIFRDTVFSETYGYNANEIWSLDVATNLITRIGVFVNAGFQKVASQLTPTDFGGVVYFNADDGVHGDELWRSDGTIAGTFMVADISTFGSSSPVELAIVGNDLFFNAFDPAAGSELWRYTLSLPSPLPTITAIGGSANEGNDGRTVIDAVISLSAPYAQAITVNITTLNGSAWSTQDDYVGYSATLVFAPGETRKTVPLQILGDTAYEADESFYLHITHAKNATPSSTPGVITILNDDSPPHIIASAPQFAGSAVAPGPAIAKPWVSVRIVFNVPVLHFTMKSVKLSWSSSVARPPTHSISLRGGLIRRVGTDGTTYMLNLPKAAVRRKGSYLLSIGGLRIQAFDNPVEKMTISSFIHFRRT